MHRADEFWVVGAWRSGTWMNSLAVCLVSISVGEGVSAAALSLLPESHRVTEPDPDRTAIWASGSKRDYRGEHRRSRYRRGFSDMPHNLDIAAPRHWVTTNPR